MIFRFNFPHRVVRAGSVPGRATPDSTVRWPKADPDTPTVAGGRATGRCLPPPRVRECPSLLSRSGHGLASHLFPQRYLHILVKSIPFISDPRLIKDHLAKSPGPDTTHDPQIMY